jgi:NACalpha-BTF3-like transcription factor
MSTALTAAEEGRSLNALNTVMRNLLLAEKERQRIKNDIKARMRNRVVERVRKEAVNNERAASRTRRLQGRRLNRIMLPSIAENEQENAAAPYEEEIHAVMTRAGTSRAEAIQFLQELDKMGEQAVNAEVTLQRLREVYNGKTVKNLRKMLKRRRTMTRARRRN